MKPRTKTKGKKRTVKAWGVLDGKRIVDMGLHRESLIVEEWERVVRITLTYSIPGGR